MLDVVRKTAESCYFIFCSVGSQEIVSLLYIVHNGKLGVNENKDIE